MRILLTMTGTVLNIATCGAWGAIRFLGRVLLGDGDKQTFFGRVAVFVAGHAVFSAMTGALSPWGLLKMFVKTALFLCAFVLNSCGGVGHLPDSEVAQAKGGIPSVKDAVKDKIEEMKAAMEARRLKVEAELEKKKREIEERDFASEIARKKHEAEAQIAKVRIEAEADVSRRKSDIDAKERELMAKAKAEIKEHTPSPWGMLLGHRSSTPEPNLIIAGQWYRTSCPGCGFGWPFQAPSTSPNFTVNCQKCGRHYDGKERPPTQTAPIDLVEIREGDSIWFTCTKCNTSSGWDQAPALGSILGLTCGKCQHFNEFQSAKYTHTTAKELGERLELARNGIKPPDGWRRGEYHMWEEGVKKHPLSPNGPSIIVSKRLRERWNSYQRSLPGVKKLFIDRNGHYGDSEPPSYAAEDRMEEECVAMARVGIMLEHMMSPSETEALDGYKGLPVGDPGYDKQHNERIAAVNQWNEFQGLLPVGGRQFYSDSGLTISYKPRRYDLVPITDEEKLAKRIKYLREMLAVCGIVFPVPSPQELENKNYVDKPENSGDREKMRKNAMPDLIRQWNGIQAEMNPAARTFYITEDGKLTKDAP